MQATRSTTSGHADEFDLEQGNPIGSARRSTVGQLVQALGGQGKNAAAQALCS